MPKQLKFQGLASFPRGQKQTEQPRGSLISSVKLPCEAQCKKALYSTVTQPVVWAFSAWLHHYYHDKDQLFFFSLLSFCPFNSLLALNFSEFHFDTLTLWLFFQRDAITRVQINFFFLVFCQDTVGGSETKTWVRERRCQNLREELTSSQGSSSLLCISEGWNSCNCET